MFPVVPENMGFANGWRSDVMTSQCVELEWLIAIDNEAFGHVCSQADFGILDGNPSFLGFTANTRKCKGGFCE